MGHRVGRIKATTAKIVQINPRPVITVEKAPKLNRPLTLMGTISLHSKTMAETKERLNADDERRLYNANRTYHRLNWPSQSWHSTRR